MVTGLLSGCGPSDNTTEVTCDAERLPRRTRRHVEASSHFTLAVAQAASSQRGTQVPPSPPNVPAPHFTRVSDTGRALMCVSMQLYLCVVSRHLGKKGKKACNVSKVPVLGDRLSVCSVSAAHHAGGTATAPLGGSRHTCRPCDYKRDYVYMHRVGCLRPALCWRRKRYLQRRHLPRRMLQR